MVLNPSFYKGANNDYVTYYRTLCYSIYFLFLSIYVSSNYK